MSLYINDIVDSAIDYLGYEGSRNVTSSWDTISNTIFIKVGSVYQTDWYYGDVYFSDLNLTVSFDENGWLDQWLVTGYKDGVYLRENGIHNVSYSKRSDIESYYDQIEAREQAEVLITQEKNTIRSTFDAQYYLDKYSEVKAAYGNNLESALDHYVRHGKAVGMSDLNESQLSSDDIFTGFSTNSATIDGGSGLDTIKYSVSSETASFSENDASQLVLKNTTSSSLYSGKNTSSKSDTLLSVERIQFSDKAYALDLDGNAGVAAKVIISAFGAENLSSKMSSILTIVDNGKTIDGISDYVIQMSLIENAIGSTTYGSFVDHVYENVVGIAPSSADHNTYTALLDNGTYTKSSLLALAANTTLTGALVTANTIDLIGVPGSADGEVLALQYDIGLG